MKILARLKSAPALLAAVVYAVAGGGFVVATLVMARVLDEHEFSSAVLLIALCNVAIAAGPSGVNGIALRHERRADRRLLLAGGACVAAVALFTGVLAASVYDLGPVAVSVLCIAIIAGGMTLLSRSAFQRAMTLQKMVILYQVPNAVLLIAACVMAAGWGRVHWFPTLMVAVSYVAVGSYAWRWVFRHQRAGPSIERNLWRDAVSFGSLSVAAEVMMQLERLLIPLVMGEKTLAQFAVIAAVALTPFRMLEMGTIATLVARLRRVDAAGRLRLLRSEFVLLLSLCLAGGGLIIVGAPVVCELVLGERRVSIALTVAVVVSGIMRVCAALAHSAALAFCEGQQLRLVNAGTWLAVLAGAILGAVLSPFGLEGLIYGVTGGWLLRMMLSGLLAARQLQEPPSRSPARSTAKRSMPAQAVPLKRAL